MSETLATMSELLLELSVLHPVAISVALVAVLCGALVVVCFRWSRKKGEGARASRDELIISINLVTVHV